MSVTRNAAVGDQAVDFLLEQFKGKVNFEGLVRCLVSPASAVAGIQELENVAEDVITKNLLATATGAQLENWRKIVGAPPGASGDDAKRRGIYLQIAINTSLGEPERLIAITKQLSGAEFVHHIHKQPGCVLLYCHGLTMWGDLPRVFHAATGGVRVVITGVTP